MKRQKIFLAICIMVLGIMLPCNIAHAETVGDVIRDEVDYVKEKVDDAADTVKGVADVTQDLIIVVGDQIVELAADDLELLSALDAVLGTEFDTWENQSKLTPTLDWLQDRVDDYDNITYREGKTTMDEIFRMSIAKDVVDIAVNGVEFWNPLSKSGESEIKGWKEIAITKKLGDLLGDKKLAEKIYGGYDNALTVVDTVNNLGEMAETISGDDPDKWLQLWLQIGDQTSEFTKYNPFWALNSNLWEYGMKTEEWKNFVEENKDNFTQAFWGAFADGFVDCMKSLPGEIRQIVSSVSNAFKEEEEEPGFIERLIGALKPSNQVGVYKPNIYFYAPESLEIDVEFLEEHLLTETIPEYAYGWGTIVCGDGKIICQDETYDFLFYESLADVELFEKETGWIIYADTRREQLLEVLALYEFNEKETADFMEFWMEKLEAGVDYVMYPQDTECVDRQMPIVIIPEPTEITRIWFGFEKYVDQEIATPQVEPIVREGFTVVEWGGFFLNID